MLQETLAKMKQYAEAHKVKLKADHLEQVELEKLRSQHAGKLGGSNAFVYAALVGYDDRSPLSLEGNHP